MLSKYSRVASAANAVSLLRRAADHIEANGPEVLTFDSTLTMSQVFDELEHFPREGLPTKSSAVIRHHHLECDLKMLPAVDYAPECGIREVRSGKNSYIWDGELPRTPNKGEKYLSGNGKVRTATGVEVMARHIMQNVLDKA